MWTGYYAKYSEYVKAGLIPVCISLKVPTFLPKNMKKIPIFSPPAWLLNNWQERKHDPKYIEEYKIEYLDNVHNCLWQYSSSIQKENGSCIYQDIIDIEDCIVASCKLKNKKDIDNLVLLCYEHPKNFCHRQVLAEWIILNYGIPCQEYDLENKENNKPLVLYHYTNEHAYNEIKETKIFGISPLKLEHIFYTITNKRVHYEDVKDIFSYRDVGTISFWTKSHHNDKYGKILAKEYGEGYGHYIKELCKYFGKRNKTYTYKMLLDKYFPYIRKQNSRPVQLTVEVPRCFIKNIDRIEKESTELYTKSCIYDPKILNVEYLD